MSEPSSFSQIVVIGSSAGGIEALSTLVRTLAADLPAPVVLAQHLDPSRESHLTEILSRSSTLPVRTLQECEPLEPGVVYVVPANRDVEITDHDIRLVTGAHRSRPSIDHLFATAADVFGENLIAVVLTGSGSDGAAGALDVQQAGGTVIIQDPETAAFPALPRSLSRSAVDFVVPLEEIGPLLTELLRGTRELESADQEQMFDLLLRRLRERHGVDFSKYKRPTLMRRIQRRMNATGTKSYADYLRYLQQHPEEQSSLLGTLLIKVTRFFRDPDLFAALRENVIPDIVETARGRDHTVRMWSAGCATGEEAYSLAILLAEVLGDDLDQFHVRIFATDLDADAVAFARHGLYTAASLSGVDPDIVDRYFERVDEGYQVSKRIRALMVFGHHDLAERAPFPRVDLVLCRNVLIYFTMELQRRILQLFAFSLRDGGYLILGKSESTTSFAEAFTPGDNRLKIYRRRGDHPVVPTTPFRDLNLQNPQRMSSARSSLYGRTLGLQPTAPTREQLPMVRTDWILFDLPFGIVVVDNRYDIQYVNDTARTLLGIHTGAIGEDVIHRVQTVVPAELKTLVDNALAGREPTSDILKTVDGGAEATRYLEVRCAVGRIEGGSNPCVTVCISDDSARTVERLRFQDDLAKSRQAQHRLEEQHDRLAGTNRELLSANQQLTREIAELRSQNEEFMVGNEELQAAAEEVETLNEELQATNEELETLNEELQATVEELNTTNDDLQTRNAEIMELATRLESARARAQAVLNSLSDAVVVVDESGGTILTNVRYDQTFARPLDAVEMRSAGGAPLPESEKPHRRGARGESFQTEVAISTPDGQAQTYAVTGRPIRGEGATGGGVVVIRELTALDGSA